jgi:uncharacterized membrane protein (DUF485 family)
MTNNTPQSSTFQDSLGAQITQNSKFHLNLAQDVIVTTEDRLRLCLNTHLNRVVAQQGWIAPISLLITLLIVFATSTFQPFIFPATTWQAIFAIGTVSTAVWSVVAVIKAWGADTQVDTLVEQIKTASQQLNPTKPEIS